MNKARVHLIAGLCAVLALHSSCNRDEALFSQLNAPDHGISFRNTLTENEDLNILDYLYYYNGGGVALGDINNDGLTDIFLTGNQSPNKLYLNKGGLQFEDISEKAGIEGQSEWNTGVTMGDVNNDGLLDIYVCAVVGVNGLNGHNELYINQGDGTFIEQAAQWKADLDTYSSSAAFLDYDLDGDLDLYVLNHAVHTQESFGSSRLREKRNYETGDRLLRNEGDHFTDVSEQAGIYGGVNSYGLGLAVTDLNRDGYPDLYIGNDFHEDDYLYLNKGDGTFTEAGKNLLGHTSRFTMGMDAADLNHDGYPELFTLDMLPQDEKVLKSSEGDDNVQMLRLRTEQLGYHYQFSRNMLQVNRDGAAFAETALSSGVAATDWSWSALLADYDQDGETDLFIANGIPRRPNDLDYIKFVSNEQIRTQMNHTNFLDREALEKMPSGLVKNFIYRGLPDLQFEDKSGSWMPGQPNISNAAAYADLDNDGDLDIVTNNLNDYPGIYINQTKSERNHYLRIRVRGNKKNTFGLGTRVSAYAGGKLYYRELYPSEGFQASSAPEIHFGFGEATILDSLLVQWPGGGCTSFYRQALNTTLDLEIPEAPQACTSVKQRALPLSFTVLDSMPGIAYTHKEDNFLDFNVNKLIPYRISDRGPVMTTGDLNGDGIKDVFIGGSRDVPSSLYVSGSKGYTLLNDPLMRKDSVAEVTAALIADLDGDGIQELLTGTGGGQFFGNMQPLINKAYHMVQGKLQPYPLPDIFQHTSVMAMADIDRDGDPDLFSGGHAVANDFGKLPESVLWINQGGKFSKMKVDALTDLGMVTDAVWTDVNQDQWPDLLVVGEWMTPVLLMNKEGKLGSPEPMPGLSGLWQSVIPYDIDHDGDEDYILGNWGTNTKFTASKKYPMIMYHGDLDENGRTETLVAIAKQGKYYPLESYDELASQVPVFMRKHFTSYTGMAGKTMEEVFGKDWLKASHTLMAEELRSGYLLNDHGKFSFVPFPEIMQRAPITQFLRIGNPKGPDHLLAGGNYFGVKPFHGRPDAFEGALIIDEKTIIPGHDLGLNLIHKQLSGMELIQYQDKPCLLVTYNNLPAEMYLINFNDDEKN